MRPLSEAIARSGALDRDMLQEIVHWKLPLELPDGKTAFTSVDEVVEALEDAIDSEDQVVSRYTELDVLQGYLTTKKRGKLHIVSDYESADLDTSFGRNKAGDYIIPWSSDSIEDMMTNGETFLKDGNRKVFFSEVREVFYGDRKAFIVCAPSTSKRPHG